MTDNLIFIGLVLISLQKILCAGECNLVNILLHFLRRHAQTVVLYLDGLFLRVHGNLNLVLHVLRLGILSHQLQLL